MKKILLLIAIIVITNAAWIYFYSNASNKPSTESSNSAIQIFDLNGTGEMWDMENYKIIVTPSQVVRGYGKIVYKDDPKNLENSTYYKFEFKEVSPSGSYDSVYSNEALSKGGPLSILDNLNEIGSISNENSYDELKKDKQNYESTILIVTWNDNEGELHSETVQLEITDEIALNQ
ncbi:hypothetical protein D3C76_18330 [compost metagenome]